MCDDSTDHDETFTSATPKRSRAMVRKTNYSPRQSPAFPSCSGVRMRTCGSRSCTRPGSYAAARQGVCDAMPRRPLNSKHKAVRATYIPRQICVYTSSRRARGGCRHEVSQAGQHCFIAGEAAVRGVQLYMRRTHVGRGRQAMSITIARRPRQKCGKTGRAEARAGLSAHAPVRRRR